MVVGASVDFLLVLDRPLDLAVVGIGDDLAPAIEDEGLAGGRNLLLGKEAGDLAHREVGAEYAGARAIELARERNADLLAGGEDVGIAAMHFVVVMGEAIPLADARIIDGVRRGALLDRGPVLVEKGPAGAPGAAALGADGLMGEECGVRRAQGLAGIAPLLAADARHHVEVAVVVADIKREQLGIAVQAGDHQGRPVIALPCRHLRDLRNPRGQRDDRQHRLVEELDPVHRIVAALRQQAFGGIDGEALGFLEIVPDDPADEADDDKNEQGRDCDLGPFAGRSIGAALRHGSPPSLSTPAELFRRGSTAGRSYRPLEIPQRPRDAMARVIPATAARRAGAGGRRGWRGP